ncbi:MAG TPA: Hpt domain-containing protein, partial [Magnetospirillum sp.]|nr:Hpt domain-containing protein [Magnetospirillum sp.]
IDPHLLNAAMARVLGLEGVILTPVSSDLMAHLGRDNAAHLIELFLREGARTVERVLALVASGGNLAELAAQAHDLKGMAAYVGSGEVPEVAAQLEQAARQADADAVAALAERLRTEWQRTEPLVRDHLVVLQNGDVAGAGGRQPLPV